MPFDALVENTAPLTWLEQELERQGITPVPLDRLEVHILDQLQTFNRPSFLYRYHLYALAVSIAGLTASAGLAVQLAPGSNWPGICALFWIALVAILICLGVLKVRIGAHWEECVIGDLALEPNGAPASTIATARALLDTLQGPQLILGELKLENVVLDPYLLLEYRGERVCLGIWDGKKIIAESTRR